MGSARENLVPQDMDIEKKPTDMTGSTRKKIRRPQIEQYPSVRTICPGEGCREHPKKQKRRCGNSSVAAAFLWPDSEKALKSRAFGQNEKVGNFCQNYLPFLANNSNSDRNPLRGVQYYWHYSFNRVSHATGRLLLVKSTRLRNSLQSSLR